MSAVLYPSQAAARVNQFVWNYVSTMIVIGFGLMFYTEFSGYHAKIYSASWRPAWYGWLSPVMFRTKALMWWAGAAYAVLLLPYYWFQPGIKSKASVVFDYLLSARSLDDLRKPLFDERQAMLATLLKFIFIPFCLNGLLGHLAQTNNHLLLGRELFVMWQWGLQIDWNVAYSVRLHGLLLNLLFIIDFLPFIGGYLVQHRWLKNEIKTVDPSLLGWVVCLLCYPPFNNAWGQFFSWGTKDYADMLAGWPWWVHVGVNLTIVVLFALYASASVSLGFKCSNLTNRGTVDSGLYGVIRHPAYAIKNLAWWVAGIPVFYSLFSKSITAGLWGVFCLSGWTFLYYMRSITEENHLLAFDPAYKAYCERVRWRFVPGVL